MDTPRCAGKQRGIDAQFSLDREKLALDVRPEAGEIDFHNNLPDADPALMALIEESEDILQVSSDDVLSDFKERMSSPHRRAWKDDMGKKS